MAFEPRSSFPLLLAGLIRHTVGIYVMLMQMGDVRLDCTMKREARWIAFGHGRSEDALSKVNGLGDTLLLVRESANVAEVFLKNFGPKLFLCVIVKTHIGQPKPTGRIRRHDIDFSIFDLFPDLQRPRLESW